MKLLKSDNFIIFLFAILATISSAVYINYFLHFVFGDALVRSFHAYQVFHGYEYPKFTAIGFVWPPLQTLLQVPLTIIKPLNEGGIAGNILSSIFLGISAIYLNKIGTFFNVRKIIRYAMTFLFIFNPLVFFYGINGMSEMIGVSFMLMTLYYFMKYLTVKKIPALIATCLSLTFAILTRWEMAILVLTIIPLIFLNKPKNKFKLDESESSAIIFLFPIFAAVFIWALISWMITGSLFPGAAQIDNTLDSQAAQIAAANNGFIHLFIEAVKKVFLLSPFFIVLAGFSFLKLKSKEKINLFAILGFGISIILSQIILYSLGKTVGELRYFIYIIPITYALAFFVMSKATSILDNKLKNVYLFGILAMTVISSLFTYFAMSSNKFNNQEYLFINAVKNGNNDSGYYNYEDEKKIAEYINQNVSKREILADDSVAFSIIYLTKNPGMFVQNIDKNFKSAVENPKENGIKYILVSRPGTDGVGDALNNKYPGIFENGTDFLTLEKDFGDWKLYRLGKENVKINMTTNTNANCTYVVKKDDSLWSISEAKYGNGDMYAKIMGLNNQTSEVIHPEQKIIVPCS